MRARKPKQPVGEAEPAQPLTLRFYGDEFIFDTASGMFFRISPTAGFIIRSLQTGMRADRLADEIQERYGISRSAALRDVELLRNDLAGIEALDRFAL